MQEIFQDSARGDIFAQKIANAKALFASLIDAEAGFSGADVLKRLDRMGLEFAPAGKDQCGLASYRSFDAGLDRSYINVITCLMYNAKNELRSDADIDGSVAHEVVHADSWDRVPEFHATPYNKNTPIILCPEDHALALAIAERIAYSNMGWFLSLAQKDYPELADIVTPVDGDRFSTIRAEEGNLGRALARAADEAMGQIWGLDKKRDNAQMTMEQYYHWSALEGYETQTDKRARRRDLPLVVRLEPHNILSLGRSFGPNIVEMGQDFAPLRALDQEWVAEIYENLGKLAGVPSRANLPTFDEGLARCGYTPASYLEMSKTAGLQSKEVPAPAPRNFVFPVAVSAGGGSGFGAMVPA